MAGGPGSASSVPPTGEHARPSIAERAARRERMQAGGRDRYGTLLRSLQAGHELPISRRGGRIAIDWHPVLGTLIKVAAVVVIAYAALSFGTQWWRENHVETWSGPDASVKSGVHLAGCTLADDIRVDVYPSWMTYAGSVYLYTGWKRPFLGPDTPGFEGTPYANGSMHLALIDNTPDGKARDTVLVWLEGGVAGVEYGRTSDCSGP